MRHQIMNHIIDTKDQSTLEWQPGKQPGQGRFFNQQTGQSYQCIDGIVQMVQAESLEGKNKKFRHLYDQFANSYDVASNIGWAYIGVKESEMRKQCLDCIEFHPQMQLLEVSAGTGANRRVIPDEVHYTGLDLSIGMLKRCQKNLAKWKKHANLFCAAAEELPFASNYFEVVYHYGGLNFFNDPQRSLEEMLRVVRPGGQVVVVDETESAAKSVEDFPKLGIFYKDRDTITIPMDLVPSQALNPKCELLFDERLYRISFSKENNS